LDLDPAQEMALHYRIRKRRGKEVLQEGYSKHNLLASYVHGHWASNPPIALNFIAACARIQASAKLHASARIR
jgi:cobyrinic acid a,c-diamide synthase